MDGSRWTAVLSGWHPLSHVSADQGLTKEFILSH